MTIRNKMIFLRKLLTSLSSFALEVSRARQGPNFNTQHDCYGTNTQNYERLVNSFLFLLVLIPLEQSACPQVLVEYSNATLDRFRGLLNTSRNRADRSV